MTRTKAALQSISTAIARAQGTLGRLRNSLVGFNTLPDDILVPILSEAGKEDKLAILNVCTRWREVCLASPRFWRTLELPTPRWSRQEMAHFFSLARLAGHPMEVAIDGPARRRNLTGFRSITHLVRTLSIDD